MEFDSFYVKLGGVDDLGMVRGQVFVGFSGSSPLNRQDIQVPVYLDANLDGSLRELREQAKDAALDLLRKALPLLEQYSADGLHQLAQERHVQQEEDRSRKFGEGLSASLRGFTGTT